MRRYQILLGILTIFVGILIFGCGDDKPTNSPPVVNNYELVLNSTYDPDADSSRFLVVFNSSNDSVIDSSYIDYAFQGMAFSLDGSTLYRSRVGANPFPEPLIWATDWETGDTVAIYEGIGGGNLAVDETGNYLLLQDNWYPSLFTVPDLQPVFVDSGGGGSGGVFIPGRQQVCYYTFAEPRVKVLDYGVTPPVTHERPVHTMAGEPVNVHAIGVSLSGDSLLLIGSVEWDRWYFLITTGDSVSVRGQYVIPPHLNYICSPILSRPYSNEVLFYFPGSFYDIKNDGHTRSTAQRASGILFRMDLKSGDCSILLDEYDFGFIFIRDLLITPDGRYAYVVTLPKLIKIDLISGQKQQVLTDRLLGGYFIALRP